MLEVAYFTPERIARTGQALGLTSDARSRFERGVDPAFLDDGLAILTGLILDICGGEPSADSAPASRRSSGATIALRFRRGRRRSAGSTCPSRASARSLNSLGFDVEGDGGHGARRWRRDVDGPADLVEEVARITGSTKSPRRRSTREPGVAKPTATRSQLVERRVRRAAAARGLDEAVTWSFISEAEAAAFGGGDWRLANPISEEMKVMRPSLLPGLLAAARRNLDRGAATRPAVRDRPALSRRRRASDRSRCCSPASAAPRGWQSGQGAGVRRVRRQGRGAGAARRGRRAGRQSAGASRRRADLASGPVGDAGAWTQDDRSPRSASFIRGRSRRSTRRPERSRPSSISTRSRRRASSGRARPAFAPPALQAVTRDFAFLVPADLAADALRPRDPRRRQGAIVDARLFDRFETADGLSLAVEVTLQPGDKSFTDEQIGEISEAASSPPPKSSARACGAEFERVDRGVDPRARSRRARDPAGIVSPTWKVTVPRRWTRPAAPQPPAVDARPAPPAARARDRGPRTRSAAAVFRRARTRVPSGIDDHRPPARRSPLLPRPASRAAPWPRPRGRPAMTP